MLVDCLCQFAKARDVFIIVNGQMRWATRTTREINAGDLNDDEAYAPLANAS